MWNSHKTTKDWNKLKCYTAHQESNLDKITKSSMAENKNKVYTEAQKDNKTWN